MCNFVFRQTRIRGKKEQRKKLIADHIVEQQMHAASSSRHRDSYWQAPNDRADFHVKWKINKFNFFSSVVSLSLFLHLYKRHFRLRLVTKTKTVKNENIPSENVYEKEGNTKSSKSVRLRERQQMLKAKELLAWMSSTSFLLSLDDFEHFTNTVAHAHSTMIHYNVNKLKVAANEWNVFGGKEILTKRKPRVLFCVHRLFLDSINLSLVFGFRILIFWQKFSQGSEVEASNEPKCNCVSIRKPH